MKHGKQVGIWGGSRAKKGGLGAPCDWMRGDAGCHCVRLLCITRRVGSTPRHFRARRCGGNGGPGPSDPSLRRQQRPRSPDPPLRRQRRPRPPRIRRCGRSAAPRSRSRHRGGARIRRSRILALLRIWLLWTRYRDGPSASCSTLWLSGPNASCPIPWLQP